MTRLGPRPPRALATFLIAWCLSLAMSGVGASQTAPVIDPQVRASIQAGRARVIVELRVEATDDPARRMALIAQAQDAVLARLREPHARMARRYASIPMLAMDIDGQGLRALESMTDAVVGVKPDGIVRPQ